MSSTLIENLRYAYNRRTKTSPKIRAYRRQLWTSRIRTAAIILGGLVTLFLIIRGIGSLI